jgi:peptidoglycan/LPS O-acetylase OafA/YrhL
MAIGGILAYGNLKITSRKINDILSTIAIMAILSTVFILDDSSKFPGYWALIPTLSSALILQSKESFINRLLLSSAPFVFLGKISYSLYLWHWPFLILCHTYYPYGSRSLWASNFFILFVVLLVSVATYFMVENQVRNLKGKKVAIALLILMAGVLYSGFWVEDNILNKLDLNEN